MNNMANIQALKKILADMNIYPHIEKLKPDDDLFSQGALDSLSLIQFVLLIEEQFGVRFENSEVSYDHFNNLNNINNLLQEKKKS